jgi:hypothetical protein
VSAITKALTTILEEKGVVGPALESMLKEAQGGSSLAEGVGRDVRTLWHGTKADISGGYKMSREFGSGSGVAGLNSALGANLSSLAEDSAYFGALHKVEMPVGKGLTFPAESLFHEHFGAWTAEKGLPFGADETMDAYRADLMGEGYTHVEFPRTDQVEGTRHVIHLDPENLHFERMKTPEELAAADAAGREAYAKEAMDRYQKEEAERQARMAAIKNEPAPSWDDDDPWAKTSPIAAADTGPPPPWDDEPPWGAPMPGATAPTATAQLVSTNLVTNPIGEPAMRVKHRSRPHSTARSGLPIRSSAPGRFTPGHPSYRH